MSTELFTEEMLSVPLWKTEIKDNMIYPGEVVVVKPFLLMLCLVTPKIMMCPVES